MDVDGPRPRSVRQESLPETVPRDATEWIGQLVDGKYEVRGLLGAGGTSAVYEAMHQGLGRLVALKLLSGRQASDPKAVARLQHEAQVVSALRHPNICEMFDLGHTSSGVPYLVMERLVGETLAERILRDAPMAFLDLAPILKQVLSALGFAHDKGLLHRDLKPENVFLERRAGVLNVKLLDFGIAQWMQDVAGAGSSDPSGSEAIAGTPYYMSPEQARGDSAIDQRVDLWALGVMSYEALTGRRPFVATNYNALLVRILTSQPRPVDQVQPEIHPAIAELVQRALSKLREDRFQSALEMRRVVNEVAEICLAEDSYAPTMVMRRRKRAPTPPPTRAVVRWSGVIEDPDTCVDDDLTKAHQTELGRTLLGDTVSPRAPGRAAAATAVAQGAPTGEAGRPVPDGRAGQSEENSEILNIYGGRTGEMPLPLPPRIGQVAPRAPTSFAKLHNLDQLMEQARLRAEARELEGSSTRGGEPAGASAGAESTATSPRAPRAAPADPATGGSETEASVPQKAGRGPRIALSDESRTSVVTRRPTRGGAQSSPGDPRGRGPSR